MDNGLKVSYILGQVFDFFLCHNFQRKIILLIKTTFKLYISTDKFSSLFKESPCSTVVTFPSFGSEGHGVQPPQGDSGFASCSYLFSFLFCCCCCFFFISFFCWTPLIELNQV